MNKVDKTNIETIIEIIEYEVKEVGHRTNEVLEFLDLMKNADEIDLHAMSTILGFIKIRYKFVSDTMNVLENTVINKDSPESIKDMCDLTDGHLKDVNDFNLKMNENLSKKSIKH